MCMKNVNATISLYGKVMRDAASQPEAFVRPFDTMKIEKSKDGQIQTDPFVIVVQMNLVESETDPYNTLRDKDCLDVKIRLTTVAKEPEEQLSVDLLDFEIDVKQKDTQESIIRACRNYLSRQMIIDVPPIELPKDDMGKYVVKVLVKRREDNMFTIQALYPLKIKVK